MLTAIHIDLKERAITFEAAGQGATRLTLSPEGIRYELLPPGAALSQPVGAGRMMAQLVERLAEAKAVEPTPARRSGVEPSALTEKQQETIITAAGRLLSKPKEGKPTAKGQASAWAMLAVHEDGRDTPHLYSTTFVRHARVIALGLEQGAQITVRGYPHESKPSPNARKPRTDTLSVFNLLDYPGRPEKGGEAPPNV